MRWKRVLAVAVAGAVLVWMGAAAPVRADVVLGTATCALGPEPVGGCAGVTAYGDVILWSSFDATAGLFRLVAIAAPGAAAQVLPVPGRPVPFDADLGPGRSGAPVAVYARCAGEPGGPPAGCGLFRLDIARASETRILPRVQTPSPLPAAIWRDRVAYSGAPAHDGLRHPTVCRLIGPRPACRTLPGGPRGGRPSAPTTGAQRLDLRGRALVLSWFSNPGAAAEIRQTRILLIRDVSAPRRAPVQVAKAGAGGAGNAAVFSPVLEGRAVYYARGGATCDYGSSPNTFGRYRLRTRALRELPSPRTHGVARAARSLVYEACPAVGGMPEPTATSIARAEPDPFVVAPPPLVAHPCPRRSAHAVGWLAPATVLRGGNAALASSPGGAVAVAAGAFDGIRVRLRPAGRQKFGRPVLIGAPNAGMVQIAVDGAGRVIVAWETSPFAGNGTSLIQAAVSDRQGRFGAPQTLRELTGPAANSSHGLTLAANPAGDAVAVWTLGASLESASRAAGQRFGPAETIWSSPASAFQSSFGSDVGMDAGGGLLVAWPVQSGGAATVQVSRRPPGGPFSPPADLASGSAALVPEMAIAPDGSGAVAWIARENRYLRVMVARRRANGFFTPAIAVSPPSAPVVRVTPAVAAADRHLLVAWAEHAENAGRVEIASARASGALGARALSAHRGSISTIEAAINASGDAVVAWELRCGGAGRRIIATTRRDGRTFTPPRSLSGRDRGLQVAPWSPLLGIDESGHAAMVWDGIAHNRLFSRFTETTR